MNILPAIVYATLGLLLLVVKSTASFVVVGFHRSSGVVVANAFVALVVQRIVGHLVVVDVLPHVLP